MLTLALRISYEEDIARFLPQGEEQQDYHEAVEQLSSQSRIVVVFTGQKDSVKQAMDAFEQHFEAVDTAQTVSDLQVTVDETQMLDVLTFVSENAPYYLTPTDYQRMDSLLALPGYVAEQLSADKQLLLLPTGGMATTTLANDPLQLFAPIMGRLQQMGRSSRFTVDEGYVFTADGRHGLAFLSSPYGTSETAHNAELSAMLDEAMARTASDCPTVKVSAVGGPLIAVSNATRIKRDSMLAVTISVVLILALLLWHYRRLYELLWIAASLGFGWLFAIAGMSLLRDSISIIVVGIGSVIIGIAVNYPLHYLDHLRETHDRRQTLRDMVPPLLIGNVTTVSAFLCLLWLDAAAIRDLGLFGALMLVGTILFVLVVMPVFLRREVRDSGKSGKSRCEVRGTRYENSLLRKNLWQGNLVPRISHLVPRKLVVPLLLILTLVLGYFSLQTSFDSDLRHINYMTDQQRQDLELLAQLSEDMPAEMADMMPSADTQEQRLQLWNDFCQRHAGLADSLRVEASRQGFADGAFEPFLTLMTGRLQPQQADYFAPVSQFLGGQHLINAKNVGAQLVEILQDSFNYVSFVCGFVVFVFLWLSFRRLELALLSFLPLAVSWLWILGLMQLLGIQFNIVNIILATFIFGQGDDYTIFITEGLVYEYTTGRRRLQSYRRSVILSAVIMFIGIGTLILARHPALHSLAEITIIGMGTVVLMAYYLPPMVFRWLVRDTRCEVRDTRCEVAKKLPITIGRVLHSLFALGFFLVCIYLFVLPFTWLYFRLGKVTEERRLKYHRLLQRMSDFVIRRVPGVKFYMENRVGETFERPAVVVSNHQSHLDLMCLMMLTPKIVFLTNDWVWHNPFYGMIIHRAEYYPVSNGIENHVEQLCGLYERGYSICVFPEGTRSEDCSILRFHQGAFYLAQQLGADILPVYLHGVGHVLPKRDFLLRKGRIDVEVGRRMPVGQSPLLEFTREMRHHYQAHYDEICQRIETDAYWAPYRRLENYYKVING
jgi:1-acyl-sn-glycerol-3-phosphate acyltransferase